MSQKIRVKLKSYDHNLVDRPVEKIVRTVKVMDAIVSDPVPLSMYKRILTANRSAFVNKKPREQFEFPSHRKLTDTYSSTVEMVDALMGLKLSSGVEVEIRVWQLKISEMPGLLGKRVGMTSAFDAGGGNMPCTVIEAGPCVVTRVKIVEKDDYVAVQLGLQDKREKYTTKPLMGHFKKAGVTPKRYLAEFKEFKAELNLGDTITIEMFNNATFMGVVGTSKGKDFQDVVKRHGFSGTDQATCGQHNRARKPGSIGACSYPTEVLKGMRMGGQLGGGRVTVQNL